MTDGTKTATGGGSPSPVASIRDGEADPSVAGRLWELGEVVEKGKRAWREVGAALEEIRRERLYREGGYESFEAYVRGRHDIEKAYGYKLVAAARAYRQVREKSPIGDAVVSAAQALAVAPLAKRDARRAAEVLEGLAGENGGLLTSAALIEAAVWRAPEMGLAESAQTANSDPEEGGPATVLVPKHLRVEDAARVVAELGKTVSEFPETRAERFAVAGRNSVGREER